MTPSAKARQFSQSPADGQEFAHSARLLWHLGSAGVIPPVSGLYLHIPFCFHKCHYCDFYSLVDTQDRQAAFVDRLIAEIAAVAPLVAGPVRTLFVGGGTPTLLRPELWRKLLAALHGSFDLSRLVEFTVEANPETVTPELLAVLTSGGGGVNRMSIGAQSFNPAHLKTLERWHDPRKVGEALRMIRAAGIDDVNLDLIFAIPGQTPEEWMTDLRAALELGPRHLSCYSLMFEPNTPLTRKLKMGLIERTDESIEAAMYEAAIDHLAASGFEQYEISNWAQTAPGQSPGANYAKHNLLYWQNENWLALGPGASGHLNGYRWKNVPHLGKYLAAPASEGAPIQDVERLEPDASFGEQLMLRLRLMRGVEREWLADRLDENRRRIIDQKVEWKLLEWTPTRLRLTRRGLLISDSIFSDLL